MAAPERPPLRLVVSDRDDLQPLIEKGLGLLRRLNPEAFNDYLREIASSLGEAIDAEAPPDMRAAADGVIDELFRVS